MDVLFVSIILYDFADGTIGGVKVIIIIYYYIGSLDDDNVYVYLYVYISVNKGRKRGIQTSEFGNTVSTGMYGMWKRKEKEKQVNTVDSLVVWTDVV